MEIKAQWEHGKKKFHKKEYNKRKEVTEQIMKEKGRTLGTWFMNIPPPSYFPEEIEKCIVNFSDNTNACTMCPICWPDVNDLKEHIKISHKIKLSKQFWKEASKQVSEHSAYVSWLNKKTVVEVAKKTWQLQSP